MSEALPLSGLVVLDISSFIAAPAAAVALADFGADVIKIEPPGEGDPHRHNYKNASYPQSDRNFPWQLDGRLKRSIALDLKNASARAVLKRLIGRADVMIVNFPPPARERLKLRWEDIEPINPRLVYCSLTGYGETGPDRDRPGWVGTSLYANGVWANGTSAAGALIGAKLPPRQPPDRPRNALTNLYRTRDDRWLQLLVVRDDRLWEPLCAAIGRPDLAADPRFTDRGERRTRALELGRELAPVFAAKSYAEWEAVFAGTGIPFGVVGRLADVIDDEQAAHAGIFADTTNPEVPRTVNNPIRLGFAKPRTSGPPPAVGQHSEEILRELSYSDADIAALRKAGALG